MAASDRTNTTEALFGTGVMMADLKRLEAQAMSKGFLIAATLIGAAAEAMADELDIPGGAGSVRESDSSKDVSPLDALGTFASDRMQ